MSDTLYTIWRQPDDGSDPVRVDEIMAPDATEALARYCEDWLDGGEFPAATVRSTGGGTFRLIGPRAELSAIPAPQHRSAA